MKTIIRDCLRKKEQLKYNDIADKCGMTWHPMIIKWCIFLKSNYSCTYDARKKSGFVTLPSERALFDYTYYIQKGCGFKPVVTMLHKEIYERKKFQEHHTNFGLLQDKIRSKSDLVYDKHSGGTYPDCGSLCQTEIFNLLFISSSPISLK